MHMHGGVVKTKVQLSSNAVAGWIARLCDKSQIQELELQDNMVNNAYIYMYQMLLINIVNH